MKQKLLHIIVAIGLLAILGSCKTRRRNTQTLSAKQGILPLQHWDFTQKPQIPLTGEWEFYWQKHLAPQDFKTTNTAKPQFAKLPEIWAKHQLGDTSISAQGYATYRLRIQLPKNTPALALKIPTVLKTW